jgi:hypothetical protein
MLHKRLLILLGGCLLMASAACADNVGYVDCSAHPDETQVFAKPRRTHDVSANLPCGERFTLLLYGFIFSRIETKDGKVGYIYSSLISLDHSGASVQQQPAVAAPQQAQASVAAPSTSAPNPTVTAAPANPAVAQLAEAPPAQGDAAPPSAAASNTPEAVAPTQQVNAPVAPQPAVSSAQPELASDQASTSNAQAAVVADAEPSSTMSAGSGSAGAAEPQPASAVPAAPPVRPANPGASWERPNPAGRGVPLVEFFGGYAFTGFNSGGSVTNFQGGMGSFGWNLKSWLQLVADSSYNVTTVSGTKNVIFGNHYGPRIYFRRRNRWGMTPFVEGLVGGSRLDTTVSGTGGYSSSDTALSFKAGGGLDARIGRHFVVRLFDADYYRTSFGSNLHQNNYWVSAGLVLRLFGGGYE